MPKLWTIVILAGAAGVACAPAVIAPGYTDRSHKLVSVEGGAGLARMPVPPQSCARPDRYREAASHLLGSRLYVLAEFTVRADGSVDSVEVTRSGNPEVTNAIIEYLKSCRYHPAESATGQPVATRVQRTLLIVRRPR